MLGVSAEKIDEEFSGDKLIRNYLIQKEKFDAFRSELSEYVANIGERELPVIFIIDELDRCNPSYAVKVLEHIKHIFDVPNIFFVLVINKEQLEYAVKGYYGSETIDAANYLRRFIDVEYNMPPLPMHKACDYLYEHYEKHGIDMGFESAQDYLDAANAVVYNPSSLHKIEEEDGDDVYYLEITNEFVVVSVDGYIRTYFNPDDGIEYFERQ